MATRHPMSSADAAWLHMDRPTNLMVINGVLWFDAPVDWTRFERAFRERIVERFDRFRQRAVSGVAGCHWEDAEPELDLHFHHVALPGPGDRQALEALVSDRASSALDHTRPLWEVHCIDGFGAGSAVLVRVHHCVGDGIALARVMLGLTDGDAHTGAGFGTRAGGGSPLATVAHGAGALAHEGLEAVMHPRRALKLAGMALEDVQTLAKLLRPGSDPRSAIHGEQHAAHRVAWSAPVALWRVKRSARTQGATVNDVLVAAVTAAVADYLEAQGDRLDEVHALVPFNLRPLDEPLPSELGNRFGMVVLALPIGVRDSTERIAEVKRRMDVIKHGHEGAISYGILELMGRTPPPVEARLIDFFSAKGSMVLTNVPGPPAPLSVAGTALSGVLVWAPCSGSIAMSVSVFSYAGKVTVGFLTDAGLVPDPGTLARAFRAELLKLSRPAREPQPSLAVSGP